MDITALTLCEVRDKIASGFFSATEVLKATIERIEKSKDLNAFITLDYEGPGMKFCWPSSAAFSSSKPCRS